jgi:hypothetical protein
MKKLLFASLFSFIITLSTSPTLYSQVSIGAFSGLNSGKFVGDAPVNSTYKNLAGLNVGLLLDLELSSYFKLSIQPSYSQEGARVFYQLAKNESPVDSIHLRLNYFSIPVFFKALTNNRHFYAIGGIEYAFLLDSYEQINDVKNDIPLDVSTWNLAFHFGAGAIISIGNPNLFLEFRYTQGIVNLTDDPVGSTTIPRVKTSGFKFLVGIEIPLNKLAN